MKYLKQFGIILAVTCIGEFLKHVIPLPIPSSIYGLLILFMKIIRLDQVKEAGEFLIEIMPLMFIPAAAGLITSWGQIRRILIPLCIIIPVSTCVVMLAAGKATDFIIEKKERHLK